jgi:S-adenosylmethionine decarboxylase
MLRAALLLWSLLGGAGRGGCFQHAGLGHKVHLRSSRTSSFWASGPSVLQEAPPPVVSATTEYALDTQAGHSELGFEGPEKTLEIEFDPNKGPLQGLRAVRREQWDAVLNQAQCRILASQNNDWFDSYVLSESSLFIYPHKLVLKTCGTTALLRCLPLLTVVTKSYEMSLEWIGYSRKDFRFPDNQVYPHTSFQEECSFLQTMFSGSAYISGPVNSDRWYVYVADDCRRPTIAAEDRTLNLMMYDFPADVARCFYASDDVQSTEDVRRLSGIEGLISGPDAMVQDHLFEPCGYSYNAQQGRAYYTMHVAPEEGNRYASFETNVRLDSYDDVVERVLRVFKPAKFTMTLFAEQTGFQQITSNPFDRQRIFVQQPFSGGSRVTVKEEQSKDGGPSRKKASQAPRVYQRLVSSLTQFSGDYLSQFGNWVALDSTVLAEVLANS